MLGDSAFQVSMSSHGNDENVDAEAASVNSSAHMAFSMNCLMLHGVLFLQAAELWNHRVQSVLGRTPKKGTPI